MPRVCVHLVEETDPEYALRFNGSGIDYDLLCLACAERPIGIEANLRDISPERFSRIVEGGF